MAQQIKFFEKSVIDLDNDSATLTVTDAVATNTGQDYISYVRNRKNTSGWMTTGSTDAANTSIVFEFGLEDDIDQIILIGHNLKSYTIKYWNGSVYADFSTPIAETSNSDEDTQHSFTSVSTTKVKLDITGTFVADSDKQIKQVIVTSLMGQLVAYPTILKPVQDKSSKITRMLSGKINKVDGLGAFRCSLDFKTWKNDDDLQLIEDIYDELDGVLLWLCGGDEDQFSTKRLGYRLSDLYLVKPTSDYTPEYRDGIYSNGIKQRIQFEETI